MAFVYRSFEASLLGLALGLCIAAVAASVTPRPADTLSVELPMLSVTAPR